MQNLCAKATRKYIGRIEGSRLKKRLAMRIGCGNIYQVSSLVLFEKKKSEKYRTIILNIKNIVFLANKLDI